MNEQENENQLEVFRANFEESLQDLLDSAEIMLDIPRPPDPASMGFDDRNMEELTPVEREVAKQVIFQTLGLEPTKLDEVKLRKYTTNSAADTPAPGEVQVNVYKTNKADLFLQELLFSDGEKRWVIGPNQDI